MSEGTQAHGFRSQPICARTQQKPIKMIRVVFLVDKLEHAHQRGNKLSDERAEETVRVRFRACAAILKGMCFVLLQHFKFVGESAPSRVSELEEGQQEERISDVSNQA